MQASANSNGAGSELHSMMPAGGCGGNSGSTCPFATSTDDEAKQQWHRSNYQAKNRLRDMADKVGCVGVVQQLFRTSRRADCTPWL
jgi:hypothetical protein